MGSLGSGIDEDGRLITRREKCTVSWQISLVANQACSEGTVGHFMVRKFVGKVSDEELQKDLERYRKMAIELGASDAKVITTDMVIVDERVRAKCMYPKCSNYGTSLNCPPHTPDVEYIRRIVGSYRYAILFKLEVPAEETVTHDADRGDSGKPYGLKRHEIVAKLEAEAFYDGYHLALGFGGGSCKEYYCPSLKCSGLEGKGCRAPLKARSAMEAVGIDVYTLATRVGWDIYPIGKRTRSSEIPFGLKLGIIFIY